jgi:YggT family protein
MADCLATGTTFLLANDQAVGENYASLTLIADAIDSVQSFVTVFIWVYTLLIFAYVILSWVRSPYSTHPVVRFLHDVCDPYLRLFRRVLPPLGPVDLSPIVAVAALLVLRYLINGVLLENLK